jgi:RNA polymerase sigma-70 factor (ECF subfamily)
MTHEKAIPVSSPAARDLRAAPPADEELMAAYQRGDLRAFEELYARYAKPIYNFLRRGADRPEVAEDLLQKTFLKLHAGRHQYQPVAPFRSWIFTLARNVFRDEARQRRRRPPDEGNELGDHHIALRSGTGRGTPELNVMVEEALRTLPLTQREVIVLSRYHGMSYGEIGRLLGISPNAVKQRAFQGMHKLAQLLRGIERRERRS